jgi:hypothetical protein
MQSSQPVAMPRATMLVHASLLAAVLVSAACSQGSGLRSGGGTTSTAAGGSGGLQTTTGAGGAAGAGGRTAATGGTVSPGSSVAGQGGTASSTSSVSTSSGASGGDTGGRLTTASGGSSGAGGAAATGGRTASSGGAGGALVTGGSSTAAGGTIATGGRTAGSGGTGGSSSLAGSGGAGAASTGGSALGGAPASGGTAGTTQPRDADPGDGGIVASGYCAGDSPKLTYQGQTVTPGVTDYRSSIVMDCCNGYGVNLHASAWLGFDVAVELILSIDVSTPKEYEVGGSSYATRAVTRKSGDALAIGGNNSQGSLRVLGADTTAKTWALGMCLEVVDASSSLLGTRIYVPRVTIGSYESNQRFQLFLLKDSTLRSDGVATQRLDDLVLAASPVLDLNRIAYVEKATTKIGFNPGQKIGDTLRTQLGTPLGLPFVAVADGIRIYLGTFFASLSSIGPIGPNANVEDITSDGFTLRVPSSGPDPRNDERIVKALTETGKLVP